MVLADMQDFTALSKNGVNSLELRVDVNEPHYKVVHARMVDVSSSTDAVLMERYMRSPYVSEQRRMFKFKKSHEWGFSALVAFIYLGFKLPLGSRDYLPARIPAESGKTVANKWIRPISVEEQKSEVLGGYPYNLSEEVLPIAEKPDVYCVSAYAPNERRTNAKNWRNLAFLFRRIWLLRDDELIIDTCVNIRNQDPYYRIDCRVLRANGVSEVGQTMSFLGSELCANFEQAKSDIGVHIPSGFSN
jgi:hypothetical protein